MQLFNLPRTAVYIPVPDGWAAIADQPTPPDQHGHSTVSITLTGTVPDTDNQRKYSGSVAFKVQLRKDGHCYIDRLCKISVRRQYLTSKWDYTTRSQLPPAWSAAGYGGNRIAADVLVDLLTRGCV